MNSMYYILEAIQTQENQENGQQSQENQDPMNIVKKALTEKLKRVNVFNTNEIQESLILTKQKYFNKEIEPKKVIKQGDALYNQGIDDNRGIKQVITGQMKNAAGIDNSINKINKIKPINENSGFGKSHNKSLMNTNQALKNKLKGISPSFNNKKTFHERTVSNSNGGTPQMKTGHRHLLQISREKSYRDAKYYGEHPDGPSPKID